MSRAAEPGAEGTDGDTVRIYRLNGLQKPIRQRLKAVQMEAARVWMYCVQRHQQARIEHQPWPSRDDLQRETKGGQYALHSQSIHMVCHQFLANVETIKQLRPSNPQKYMTVEWPAQAVSREGKRLILPMGRGCKSFCLDDLSEEKPNMGIISAMGNTFLALQKYENWPEVIISIAKRREPAKLILKNGFQIEAAKHLKFLVREIFFRKVYNPVNLPIGENDIVVDIGAHNGIFTLFAASITKNMVYAFEPTPASFEFLKRNIDANGLNNVIARNAAVSDKIGSTKLFLSLESDWQNMLVDYINPDKIEKYKLDFLTLGPDKPERYVEVPTTTLQDIMDSNNIGQLDFLKMDCQGSEGSILQSTPRDYLERVRKIAMEFHDQLSNFEHNDIQKILGEADFITELKWVSKSSPEGYLYAWRN